MPSARRYRPRKGDVKELLEAVKKKFGESIFDEIGRDLEILKLETQVELIISEDKIIFFRKGGEIYPTLNNVDMFNLGRVTVDMGAVPYVASGADVMGPGVVSVDPGIKQGNIIKVVDERHEKSIAVGLALTASEDMVAPKGKVVKNIHHVGDKIWPLLEKG